MRRVWQLLAFFFRPDARHAAVNPVAEAQFPVVQAVRVRLAFALARASRARGRHLISRRTLVWFRVQHGRRGGGGRRLRRRIADFPVIGAPPRNDGDGPRGRGGRRQRFCARPRLLLCCRPRGRGRWRYSCRRRRSRQEDEKEERK